MLARSPSQPSMFKRVLDAVLAPKPPAMRAYQEMGRSGTAIYGGYVATREKSSQWIGQQRYVTIADMAVNTTIIATGLHYFLNLIARPTWTFEPANTKGSGRRPRGRDDKKQPHSADATAAAEFVEEIFQDMSQPWARVVRRAGTYRFHGFGIQEWTAKKREDGRIGLESIEPRPQSTIERWSVSDSGAVEGVWQRAPQTGTELGIPRKKFLYLVDDVLSDSPEGIGIFRHLAEPWERLKQYYALEARAFERDLRGTPVGRVPYTLLREAVAANDLTRAQADNLISEMEKFVKLQVKQSDTAITLDSIPYYSQAADGAKVAGLPQWGLELLQGGSASTPEVAAAIIRTQTEMARLMTCEHLMMGESSGNRALGEDKSRNLYLVACAVLADITAAVQRDLMPVICELNGIPDELVPTATTEDVAFQDVEMVANTLAKMAQAGAVLSPDDQVIEDIRALMGVSPPTKSTPEMMGLAMGDKPGDEEKPELDEDEGKEVKKFNPNHDELGRFSEGPGDGGSGGNRGDALERLAGLSNIANDEKHFPADAGDEISRKDIWPSTAAEPLRLVGGGAYTAEGIWHETRTIDPNHVVPTQPSVVRAGVENYLNGVGSEYEGVKDDPVVAFSSDGKIRILSGHHRLAAAVMRGDKSVSVTATFYVFNSKGKFKQVRPKNFKLEKKDDDVEKYNENHDELGRFASGSGGGGKGWLDEIVSGTSQKVEAVAAKVVADLGFSSDDVFIDGGVAPTFILNGQQFNTAGLAHLDTGKIILYSQQLTPSTVAGITAHEVMHQKFENYMKDVTAASSDSTLYQEYTELTMDWEGLKKDDGITEYSRQWWKAATSPDGGATFKQAYHETLAEMARLDYENSPIWHSQKWRAIYKVVSKHWGKKR